MTNSTAYKVEKLSKPIVIDANWNKSQWQGTEYLEIANYMGSVPGFRPAVRAKMMYDEENLYVIFNVDDRYIKCVTNNPNGPVWEDSCVEFFFSPDTRFPERYFNLEVNCGGTPLMHYNIVPRRKFVEISIEDIQKIQIAHTLPELVNPEIKERLVWNIEYRIPVDILKNYSEITSPKQGVEWKANFYKCAEKNSNPHFITWSIVQNEKPDFHLPGFFGTLKFQ